MAQIEAFLDVLFVEEILEGDAGNTGIVTASGQEVVVSQKAIGKPPLGRVVAVCKDGKFPMHGLWVDMPYKVGDIVATNEFGRNYEIYLNRDRQYRPGVPKPGVPQIYLIHYADVEGRVIEA